MAAKKRKSRLFVFCGIPGSGKTTIARLVAAQLVSAVHIQTDTLRSMISGPDYSWAESQFIYASMFLVGREALKSGHDVILDGTFLKEDYRSEAAEKMAGYYSAAFVVCVLCDPAVAWERNSRREAAVPEESFERLASSFEEPRDAIFVHSDEQTAESSASYVLSEVGGNHRSSGAPPIRAK